MTDVPGDAHAEEPVAAPDARSSPSDPYLLLADLTQIIQRYETTIVRMGDVLLALRSEMSSPYWKKLIDDALGERP